MPDDAASRRRKSGHAAQCRRMPDNAGECRTLPEGSGMGARLRMRLGAGAAVAACTFGEPRALKGVRQVVARPGRRIDPISVRAGSRNRRVISHRLGERFFINIPESLSPSLFQETHRSERKIEDLILHESFLDDPNGGVDLRRVSRRRGWRQAGLNRRGAIRVSVASQCIAAVRELASIGDRLEHLAEIDRRSVSRHRESTLPGWAGGR